MGNRIKRMQCLYQFREGQPKRHKPTANHAVIEQTPNTRGGYLIAFVAGLLTYPSLPRLPSPMTSGRLWQLFVGTYSSRYCPGFSPDSLFILSGLPTDKKLQRYKSNKNVSNLIL